MYGDFSRVLDVRSHPYSAVLAQQGRFLLDAELNEQSAIVLDYLRRLTVDLIGPFGGPVHHAGFKVELVVEDAKCRAVKLSRGHYYVYGLRCEAPWPGRTVTEEIALDEELADPFVVYLVVWEQTIGVIQAPELAEPALGHAAPDTTRRSQVRWRPRAAMQLRGGTTALTEQSPEEIVGAFHQHNVDPDGRPRMGARARKPSDPADDVSTAPAEAAYRGVENQLYRVEIHRGGSREEATFKWSRDNGSVELALDSLGSRNQDGRRTAKLPSAWRDARSGVEVGDWVELVDDRWAPFGVPPSLLRVHEVALFKRELLLEDAESERSFSADLHPFLRRWDQDPDELASDNAIAVEEAVERWFELEDGVQIRFDGDQAHYERGDFWLVPARTATRGVIWPQEDGDDSPLAVHPHGPIRYCAPLALVPSLAEQPVDLRTRFAHVQVVDQPDDDTQPPEEEPGDDDESSEEVESSEELDESPTAQSPAMPGTPMSRWRLVALSGFDPGVVFELKEGDTTIGRDRVSGIPIERPEISRHHAILTVEDDDRLTVKDARSGNGTFVNGEQSEEVTELEDGDVIGFGTSVVRLKVERA